MKSPLLSLLLLLLSFATAQAKRRHRGHLPIDRGSREDEVEHGRKASECRFGDKRYELEQTWNPDLGPPFGVMHCVHCECVPIHKKRRIVGRVRCRSIKDECPKPTCPDPILHPGRCCKVCPGQTNNPDLNIEVDLAREEEEKNGRHYASLLTPPEDDLQEGAGRRVAATARFHFRRKTLTYSLVTSEEFGIPKFLTFMDPEKNIIEEFPIQDSIFQNKTGKICGAWNRLPKRYRRQLRRDALLAQLTSADGTILTGKVAKHYGLSSELFSGLLMPEDVGTQGAATSIVSVSPATGSFHAMILMGGGFLGPASGTEEKSAAVAEVPLTVIFESHTRGEVRIIEEELKTSAGKTEQAVDFKTVLDQHQLEALGQGRLRMRVMAPSGTVSGLLAPRFTCDFFDAVLSPSPDEEIRDEVDDGDEEAGVADPGPIHDSPAKGLVWMSVARNGDIEYNVRIVDFPVGHSVTSVQLDNGRRSRRLHRVAASDLSFGLKDDDDDDDDDNDGRNGGGVIRLDTIDLEALYNSDLYVNVATSRHARELRGRLVMQSLTEAQGRKTFRPILLKGDGDVMTKAAGIAWTSMDSNCGLNYQVRLSGTDPALEATLLLEDFPLESNSVITSSNTMPGRSVGLAVFKGQFVEGTEDELHKLTVARMEAGDAALIVRQNFMTVEGRIKHLHTPSECLPRYARNELELMPGFLSDLGEVRPEAEMELATRCLYEGKIHDDGEQWEATHKSCHMCSCRRGTVVCDEVICPELTCEQPVILEGECCAACDLGQVRAEDPKRCYFEGDKKYHTAGVKWHPYIPPFGFSRCATCTCNATTLKVECSRTQCPPLDCPMDEQERPDPLACCRVCKERPAPKLSSFLADPDRPHDEGFEGLEGAAAEEAAKAAALSAGGCLWRDYYVENGATWHPKIVPHGEMKCVTCKCKDGIPKCSKQSCPELSCHLQVKDKGECCPRCAVNKAEKKRAKKLKRLLKLRKLRRLQRQRQQQQQQQH